MNSVSQRQAFSCMRFNFLQSSSGIKVKCRPDLDEMWNWLFKMGNIQSVFLCSLSFSLPYPLNFPPPAPHEYAPSVPYSLILCFAVKQNCNLRRLSSIFIAIIWYNGTAEAAIERDWRPKFKDNNSSVSSLKCSTRTTKSLQGSYVSLSLSHISTIIYKWRGNQDTQILRYRVTSCWCSIRSPNYLSLKSVQMWLMLRQHYSRISSVMLTPPHIHPVITNIFFISKWNVLQSIAHTVVK